MTGSPLAFLRYQVATSSRACLAFAFFGSTTRTRIWRAQKTMMIAS